MLPNVHFVLMPGLHGTRELFGHFVRALPKATEITVVDYGVETCEAEWVAIASSALPVGKEFILVAESFSGPIAIQVAARNPKGLRGLVLCASFARAPVGVLERAIVDLFGWVTNFLPLPRPAARYWLAGSGQSELISELLGILRRVPRGVIYKRLRYVMRCDVRGQLKRIGAPILYLEGKQDRLVARAAADDVEKACAGVKRAVIDGPHLLLQTRSRECVQAIEQFLGDAVGSQSNG